MIEKDFTEEVIVRLLIFVGPDQTVFGLGNLVA